LLELRQFSTFAAAMAKTGRNDPCPCGSGNKYKRCCLPKDEAAEHAKSAQVAAKTAATQAALEQERLATRAALEHEHDLAEASNAVVDLVHAGRLDEAESGARELLVRFPDVHDGYDRLGMVYEARGLKKQAADCYRQVIQFVRDHPEQYAPEFADTFHQLVAELDRGDDMGS
jgi:tetratricopeptide (TPR) repeat protein